jgi:hypothetical protein
MKPTLRRHLVAILAIVPLAMTTGAEARLDTVPTVYNPGKAPVQITAAWASSSGGVPDEGPSSQLILQISDTVAYPPGAAATSVVTPVEGLTVTHLAFDHQLGTYCTNGSPRWDVETVDGSVYAFGCASGIRQVDLPAVGWERVTFTCADVQVLKGVPGSCPLGSTQTVSRLQIVQDEGGSATTLANLDVNWSVMSGPGQAP